MVTLRALSFAFQIPTTLFLLILIHCVMSITWCYSSLNTEVLNVQMLAKFHLTIPSGIQSPSVWVILVTSKDPAFIEDVSWSLPTWLLLLIYLTAGSQKNSGLIDSPLGSFIIIEEWVLLPDRCPGPGETLETHTIIRQFISHLCSSGPAYLPCSHLFPHKCTCSCWYHLLHMPGILTVSF